MKNILITIFALMISSHTLAGGIEACPTNKVDKCSNVKTKDACNASYAKISNNAVVKGPDGVANCIWYRNSCMEKHACELK